MRRLQRAAAALSVVAGALHLMAGPEHFEEWWGYGVFFLGAAVAQAGYGLVLWTEGVEGWGGWLAVRRHVYLVGIAMTLAIVVLWVVSRTVGVPVGPEAFEPEGIGPLDLSSKAIEIVLVLLLARLWWMAGRPAPRSGAAAS